MLVLQGSRNGLRFGVGGGVWIRELLKRYYDPILHLLQEAMGAQSQMNVSTCHDRPLPMVLPVVTH